LIYPCGVFNARIGDNNDFIEGVDDLPQRQEIDFTSNMYGDELIQFLLDSSKSGLNGRNTIKTITHKYLLNLVQWKIIV
jgi:hypothetical protein